MGRRANKDADESLEAADHLPSTTNADTTPLESPASTAPPAPASSPRSHPSARAATVVHVTTEEMIVRAVAALAAAAPPRSRVILFGSHARGQAGVDSDLDFLVIEPDVERTAAESVRLRRVLREIPAAIDVVVVSEELAERRARVPGTMVDRALREGRVVAES